MWDHNKALSAESISRIGKYPFLPPVATLDANLPYKKTGKPLDAKFISCSEKYFYQATCCHLVPHSPLLSCRFSNFLFKDFEAGWLLVNDHEARTNVTLARAIMPTTLLAGSASNCDL